MAASGSVFTISADRSFVDALAHGILARIGTDPMSLARARILLPTRRAERALRAAFLHHGARDGLLLPRISTFGAPDDDAPETLGLDALIGDADIPPAIGEMRRRLILARLIRQGGGTFAGTQDMALRLADELARLVDQVHTEGLDWARLADLVDLPNPQHWQDTVAFLRIVTEHWPRILDGMGLIDPADRRNRLLRAMAAAWRANPPDGPIFAAGTTGTVPATAALVAAVAGLPNGVVVLPGLDRALDDDDWAAVGPTHPQYGLKHLLDQMGLPREAVADWPRAPDEPPPMPDRLRLVGIAQLPASRTGDVPREDFPAAQVRSAMAGVTRVDCPTPQDEATAIALALRGVLETPERTGVLVTPDRQLAARVAALLARWHIAIDDSAGRRLSRSRAGRYLLHLLEAAIEGLAPVPLLALLHHPLVAEDMRGAHDADIRTFERRYLRGPRPAPGFEGLRARVAADDAADHRTRWLGWLDSLEAKLGPLAALCTDPRATAPLTDYLAAHIAAAEALAGADSLWAGDDGNAAQEVLDDLGVAAADCAPLTPDDYLAVLTAGLESVTVRPGFGTHPRLAILGPLEARLQRHDLVVLGGLNDGTWPPDPGIDPWMSRPMRATFGLPGADRRIGLSAHDFAQCFAAPEVMLTRALRVDGAPTTPSRWLLRLDATLDTFGGGEATRFASGDWLAWAAALDRPKGLAPVARPAPTPPVAARPRRLSVTQIEMWRRNPYAVYARHVLGLRKLDDLDEEPGAADFGNVVHDVLDRFVASDGPGDGPGTLESLLALGRQVLDDSIDSPAIRALWWPRIARVAAWFAERQDERAHAIARTVTERKGEMEVMGQAGPFTLSATADRIDLLADGTARVIDYKTGAPPSATEVAAGYAPQLTLEGAMVLAGGFEGVSATAISALEYWRVGGLVPAGEVKSATKGPPDDVIAEAKTGLAGLVARFDDAATPYLARPSPKHAPRYDDYQHLARTSEWSAVGGEDPE